MIQFRPKKWNQIYLLRFHYLIVYIIFFKKKNI